MGVGAHGVHDRHLPPQQRQVLPEHGARHDLQGHLRTAGPVPSSHHRRKVATALPATDPQPSTTTTCRDPCSAAKLRLGAPMTDEAARLSKRQTIAHQLA